MTSTPKRHSGISADTGQGGLTVHRQLDARRHDRDAHLPNQTPHARLACVRASVWVCRCARRIVLHAMAAAAAQFDKRTLRRAQRRTHTRAQTGRADAHGPKQVLHHRRLRLDLALARRRRLVRRLARDLRARLLTCSPVLTRATSLQALTPPRAVTRSTGTQ
jgi:hypothetical protein